MQDSLALVTGLAIITTDYKGVPITEHSERREFCSFIRENQELFQYCQKCDSRGGLEAVRIGKPYTYLCHCQIVDIAIPIILDDRYVGAIMAGQIRIHDKEEDNLEKILNSPASKPLLTPTLRYLYEQIPTMSLERLLDSVEMLSNLINYIVEEAINKNLVLDMYERMLSSDSVGEIQGSRKMQVVENIRKDLGEAVTSTYIKSGAGEKVVCTNKILQPAFDYFNQHKGEMLSQKKAAELCHISTGHFSRLFVKETGEHFSSFYSRQKVIWSMQLLEKTDLSVTQISDELGFSDPGYFIKTFRKYEGITPAAYRKFAF